jgi:putative membrane protein
VTDSPDQPPPDRPSADPDTRARTHLANERTFLAWFRTGITLVALGLAAGQFLTRDIAPGVPVVRGLSTLIIATGAFIVSVGIYRYLRNRQRVAELDFRPAGVSVVLLAVAALVIAILAIIFVWLIPTNR